MKLHHRPLLAYLFLTYAAAAATDAKDHLEHVAELAEGKSGRDVGLQIAKDPLAIQDLDMKSSSSSLASSKDASDRITTTNDAPVDGQDGRPHEGPFVETNAERDRKKAKEKGDDDLSSSSKKTKIKDGSSSDDMPDSNDGVMDDPHREGPKEGTRGTEGGISGKNREKALESSGGKKVEKTPSEPKEVPPLPHSEQAKLAESEEKSSKSSSKTKADSNLSEEKTKDKDISDTQLGGMKKPDDLPDKPHDIPHPVPNSGASKEDPLDVKKPVSSIINPPTESNTIIHPLHSFVLSLTMIIFSEIGDKTFLIAALMAMKHPPLLVLSAAFPALLTMTVLSAVLGHALPTLLPVRFTGFLAALLFLFFGLKMLKEGQAMKSDEGVGEEMREVEMELEEKEQLARKLGGRRSSMSPYMLEAGLETRKGRSNSRLPAPPDSPPDSPDARSPSPSRSSSFATMMVGVNNLFSLLLSPAWVQTFVMTFLGEWGDRSQIATIAMAAGQDYWWVTTGALVGHFGCTVLAVVGGRAIAGRVSMRVVTLGGAFAFLAFGLIYLAEAIYYK